MAKQQWKPSTMLNPVPVVMVTCAGKDEKPNIITLAWVGTINSDPPMVSISVRKERHSYQLLKERGEFVINLTTKKLTFATDFCGVKSGRDIDKFKETRLTPEKAFKVSVPLIKESPVNIECVVRESVGLGSHVMFIAEIVAVNVDESILNEKGKLCLEKAEPICFSHGEYWSLEKSLGYFGYSINKRSTVRNRNVLNKGPRKVLSKVQSEIPSKVSKLATGKVPSKIQGKVANKEPRKVTGSISGKTPKR
jgi:flavin reductase (DIM6/NTAB) family NADH-FMN oxidoreductase RutF